ncbi:flagellar basal body P-ring formation chaperone FlgA [Helicobacter cetorum]|uniref:Flagella basal body P-ring formation protein FlgA n=1 Tax=Helicobacter cetorum (strain ATCC BAA-429 / MIT 00-7128) TaxID=182217 RepID=I0EKY0_HELC0|nr:flagellar basal body P-ring formation chaperone FlgA [Helicobacter cetorum]AFI03599.1 flagellar basal body P-ring biosynthesis protein FlgA [Helicobacter cetorum MIT 00-7128]
MKAFIGVLIFLNLLFALDLNTIEKEIAKTYLKEYQALHLEIEKINLNLAERFNNAKILSYELGSKETLRKDGVVFLNIELENQSKMRLPVRYSIIGSIQAFKSVGIIKKDENITEANTLATRIPFGSLESPLLESAINHSSAKVYIAPSTLLNASKVQALIVVHKGDVIVGVYQEGRIILETNLQVLENGALNSVIQAKNLESNKILKVRILSSSKAQVL